jgi:hypothetical protein
MVSGTDTVPIHDSKAKTSSLVLDKCNGNSKAKTSSNKGKGNGKTFLPRRALCCPKTVDRAVVVIDGMTPFVRGIYRDYEGR